MAKYKGREVNILADLTETIDKAHVQHLDGLHETVNKAELLLTREERAKEVEKFERQLAELKARFSKEDRAEAEAKKVEAKSAAATPVRPVVAPPAAPLRR